MAGKEEQQSFSFETMAVVLYCVLESGVTLGDKHYHLMSKLHGDRSANAFNHQFRKVKARAKELKEQSVGDGGIGSTPRKPKTPSGSKTTAPASGSKKRGHMSSAKAQAELGEDDSEDGTPIKKPKFGEAKIKKPIFKKEEPVEDDQDDGLNCFL